MHESIGVYKSIRYWKIYAARAKYMKQIVDISYVIRFECCTLFKFILGVGLIYFTVIQPYCSILLFWWIINNSYYEFFRYWMRYYEK